MFLGKSQHYGRAHKLWWFLEQPKKSENYLKQRDFRICVFLRAFCGFFLRGFAGFIPSRLMRCKHFLAFVSPNPKTCNQSPKIQDLGVLGKNSRYRSNSENTNIFLGFGGSRYVYIYIYVLILYHPMSLLCLIYSSIIYHICSPILLLHINTPLYYHMYIYICIHIYIYILVGGLQHFLFFPSIGKLIIPFDQLHHVSEGWRKTTKQLSILTIINHHHNHILTIIITIIITIY